MHVVTRSFWLPKAGNEASEYEDACWPQKVVNQKGERFRFAIADGATESVFSAVWARQLVQGYGSGQLDSSALSVQIAKVQRRWLQQVRRKPLSWYLEEKVLAGAHAAFLGLVVEDNDQPVEQDGSSPCSDGCGQWCALAVGDCCLAQVRNDGVVATFPYQDSASFTSRPYLLSSRPIQNRLIGEHLVTQAGRCETGDKFFLMTDALASWFLRDAETEGSPWHVLGDVHTTNAFKAWISELRSRGEIRNDDVTLLCVYIL